MLSLTDFPLELRQHVYWFLFEGYQATLTPSSPPSSLTNTDVGMTSNPDNCTDQATRTSALKPGLAAAPRDRPPTDILLTNRSVYRDAKPILYKRLSMHISRRDLWNDQYTPTKLPAAIRQHLRYLKLDRSIGTHHLTRSNFSFGSLTQLHLGDEPVDHDTRTDGAIDLASVIKVYVDSGRALNSARRTLSSFTDPDTLAHWSRTPTLDIFTTLHWNPNKLPDGCRKCLYEAPLQHHVHLNTGRVLTCFQGEIDDVDASSVLLGKMSLPPTLRAVGAFACLTPQVHWPWRAIPAS